MTYQTTISADTMHRRPQWKSEQQYINEHLYCDGLPYFQADMTDLHYGMKYKGKEPAPVQVRNADGSFTVTWSGTPVEKRQIDYPKKRVTQVTPWMGV